MIYTLFVLLAAAFLNGCSSQEQSDPPHSVPATLLISNATYDEVNKEVGCDSKYVDEKKSDLFSMRYKNHWMTWEGKVFHAEPESVSLDINGKGIHELQAVFADARGGYSILIGSTISIRFVMRGQGGCFLPFTGDSASIVEKK